MLGKLRPCPFPDIINHHNHQKSFCMGANDLRCRHALKPMYTRQNAIDLILLYKSKVKITSNYFFLCLYISYIIFALQSVCVCVPMPTHCTITCFGFHARWIDGVECGLFSNHALLGQTTLRVG